MRASILLVDDDRSFYAPAKKALEAQGFNVTQSNVLKLEEYLTLGKPEVVIVDETVSQEIGRNSLSAIKHSCLLIFLVAPVMSDALVSREVRQVADNHARKSVLPDELAILVRELLSKKRPDLLQNYLKVGDLTLDRESQRVHRQRREVKLSPTEFKLLEHLMQAPGQVFSRAALKALVWGENATVDDRAIDVQIGRLRRLVSLGKADNVIRTVRGMGYVLGNF
ncbi:winged helix-turn-helix domain-containing protein [Rhizobium metallidurans]|uniref:Two-component system phosphate regulon response regulator PhoB n=1 Tax=Rhizobium metallidurans TaxID=1265931 RepID=A0A7W6CY98_9HYPH|nr:response regulator transcription factor [Rhizobium metallidurans]MBB3967293.1 two-component system phosphate regulon response regulator PhoB [Rhizobium metallidurans]